MDTDRRTLVLVRHAKAEPHRGSDHGRRLDRRGHGQVAAVAANLQQLDLTPDVVLVSSAARTRETWERIAEALGLDPRVARFRDDLYEASHADVVAAIAGQEDRAHTVLVIGHEPTISTVADVLAGESSDSGAAAQVRVGMPTGGVAVLTGELGRWADLAPGSLRLETVLRP